MLFFEALQFRVFYANGQHFSNLFRNTQNEDTLTSRRSSVFNLEKFDFIKVRVKQLDQFLAPRFKYLCKCKVEVSLYQNSVLLKSNFSEMLVFWKQSFIDKNETFDNGNAVHNCPKTGENSTMGPNSLYKAQWVKIIKKYHFSNKIRGQFKIVT